MFPDCDIPFWWIIEIFIYSYLYQSHWYVVYQSSNHNGVTWVIHQPGIGNRIPSTSRFFMALLGHLGSSWSTQACSEHLGKHRLKSHHCHGFSDPFEEDLAQPPVLLQGAQVLWRSTKLCDAQGSFKCRRGRLEHVREKMFPKLRITGFYGGSAYLIGVITIKMYMGILISNDRSW